MAETEFREWGTQGPAREEDCSRHSNQGVEREEKGDHVTEGITKNLTRKI
jgi:hypothetical protein